MLETESFRKEKKKFLRTNIPFKTDRKVFGLILILSVITVKGGWVGDQWVKCSAGMRLLCWCLDLALGPVKFQRKGVA
jgi:hypothetical protein